MGNYPKIKTPKKNFRGLEGKNPKKKGLRGEKRAPPAPPPTLELKKGF
eukprot:UN4400